MKNPLAALKGGLQFLSVELEQGRSLDTRGSYLQLMLEQVERANREHAALLTHVEARDVEAAVACWERHMSSATRLGLS